MRNVVLSASALVLGLSGPVVAQLHDDYKSGETAVKSGTALYNSTI
jgi:hypothetical protein